MTYAFQNPHKSAEDRVTDLMSRMTLGEKIAQMHALWLILDENGNHHLRDKDAFIGNGEGGSLKDVLSRGLGQITRPMGSHSVDPAEGVRALNRLQKFMIEETRLGIPVMTHEECLSGMMARGGTLFPSALAYGATFDPELIEAVGKAIGDEARALGCHQGLAPVLDVARDARWGRTEETFGEDPYLAGVMATRYVRGLQGEKRDVLATLKHFAGHSFSEGGRNHAPVHLGWRELNDIFLLPFEMAIKQANAGSVMPAYHDIDNEPLHASHHLLTEVLREEWGFNGLIVADYIGVSLLYQHHGIAADPAEAAALSFNAGLDIELPGNECSTHLEDALSRGLISMETIDAVVTRVLTEKVRLGLFEKPFVEEGPIQLQTPEAIKIAAKVAEEAITVVSNTSILPLAAESKIALIGPAADDPLALLGDYSFPVHLILSDLNESAKHVITPRAAFEKLGLSVSYARGCNILDERKAGAPVFPGDVDDSAAITQADGLSTCTDMIAEAVETAKAADIAILCLGDLSGIFQTGTVGEGSDVDSLALPGVQQQLLDAVLATGTPVVVVLSAGRPYTLGSTEDRLAAQVWSFFGGQQGGTALVDVLTGRAEPSGRLTISVPKSAGAAPYFYNHKFKSSGTPIARHFGSAYPFGHGLSYTSFAWSDLILETPEVAMDGEIIVSFAVENTGNREGIAVPQLYVHDMLASLVRPVKELKAFGRVLLQTGEKKRVRFAVPVDMLNFTGSAGKRIVEPGDFEIMIGASSADLPLRAKVKVTGETTALPRVWRMESRMDLI